MKIKFESDDDLTLGKILNIPVCVILNIPVLELFFKKTTTIIHKFIYINVCMSMNMTMKMIFIPLYN